MSRNIGLNVVEVDGAGAPAIVGAAVSVGGFNILTRRGVPNRATQVTSFPQFVAQFGSFFSGGLGAYLVKGFFDNGGRTAYVNRVVATDAVTGAAPAVLILDDAAAADNLRLRGGQRGSVDPGTWGDDLYARVTQRLGTPVRIRETARATIQGTPLAAQVDMTALPSLSVRIDGAANPTVITFQASDFANPAQATRIEIRNAIRNRTTDLTADLSGDFRLVLTSAGNVALLAGTWSSLQVTAANATLGFAVMANPTLGTAAAITAGGTQLANVSGFVVGDVVRISDGTTTATVKLQSIVNSTSSVTWAPALANPAVFVASSTTLRRVEFDLTLAHGGTEDANVVETWTGLSMEPDLPNYAVTVLNDSLRGSRWVIANREGAPAVGGPQPQPAAIAFTRFTPGRDGTPTAVDFVGDAATRTGWNAFDPYDVQLLCSERTDPAIVTAALAYCELRGDCMFVGSVPEGYVEAGQALAYGKAFQGKKVYGALYGPWIKVLDPLSRSTAPYKFVPAVGHVMGVYSRVESTRGVWKAPAGDEANLLGALDVEFRLTEADHTDLVKNGSVNGIRVVPGSGIVVDASRTLSTDTRWLYVNVRLLFNYVKSSLRTGLRWVRQEPNRDRLWNLIKFNSITPFLLGLWRQGAFGTGSPEEVFTVICDASNNPPEEVEQGNLKVEVYFYPSRPAETIVIQVGQQPAGGFAAES